MEYLKAHNLPEPSSIGIFAHNELVFAGIQLLPISGLHDLPKLRKIAIGSPKSVPACEYATASLRRRWRNTALQ